jgi:NAD-dependent dihydropyrimidine dehydrogenase PreA subunit
MNKDKGAVAKKNCSAACIGCGKCQKECKFEASTIENNLSYIDPEKCRLCRKCEAACPTGAILAINFPARKPKSAENTSASTEATVKVNAPKNEETVKVAAPKNEETVKVEAQKAEPVTPKTTEEEAKA